jgi:hypothetical protein
MKGRHIPHYATRKDSKRHNQPHHVLPKDTEKLEVKKS